MDKSTPDYSKYSYKELLEVHTHIDRVRFPERFEHVQKMIAEKVNENDIQNEEYSDSDKVAFGILSGELLFWLIVGIAALLGYSIF